MATLSSIKEAGNPDSNPELYRGGWKEAGRRLEGGWEEVGNPDLNSEGRGLRYIRRALPRGRRGSSSVVLLVNRSLPSQS